MRNAYKILVGKPEGKRPFGRSRRRWKNNITMDFREITCEDVDLSRLTQDRVQGWAPANTVMGLRFP
jgi:hypothetical protein